MSRKPPEERKEYSVFGKRVHSFEKRKKFGVKIQIFLEKRGEKFKTLCYNNIGYL